MVLLGREAPSTKHQQHTGQAYIVQHTGTHTMVPSGYHTIHTSIHTSTASFRHFLVGGGMPSLPRASGFTL